MTATTAVLNFGGFYHSEWDLMIDYLVDTTVLLYEDEDHPLDSDEIIGKVDFKATRELISKAVVNSFNQACGLDVVFKALVSPKEYNFQTDTIEVLVSEEDAVKVDAVLSEMDLWDEYEDAIIEATAERSGYMPFYSVKTLPEWAKLGIKLDILFSNHSNQIYEQTEADAELVML